jgi:ABC-2 type transport system ATP-binding protein
VLGQVGLDSAADRRVGGFSLGMRQRLGLATALLHDPEILILDEPANGLDPEGVRWLRDLVRGLAAAGRTVLFSSHILAEVAHTIVRILASPAYRDVYVERRPPADDCPRVDGAALRLPLTSLLRGLFAPRVCRSCSALSFSRLGGRR